MEKCPFLVENSSDGNDTPDTLFPGSYNERISLRPEPIVLNPGEAVTGRVTIYLPTFADKTPRCRIKLGDGSHYQILRALF